MNELFKGIYSKYKSSTGAGTLYADLTGGLYNTEVPQDTSYPYAAFYLISNVPHWTFDATMENSMVQFSIFDDRSGVNNIGNLYQELIDLYDWTDLSSTGNYYHVFMKRESSNLLKNEDVFQYVVNYRIEYQKK